MSVWLDKPDSEGWWWLDCFSILYIGYVGRELDTVMLWNFDSPTKVVELNGKWCKSIVPELPKEEKK